MNVTTYGLDLAKRVFQVHWVEMDTGELKRKTLARAEVAAFFAHRPPGIVAMESCGSAHYWGRVLSGLGHEVRLIAAQFVRPFVKTNKTDAADAEAIWETAQRPGMRFVALKSEEQQAVLSLHRMRAQLVKIRGMQSYQVRSLLYEFGVVTGQGFAALKVKAAAVLGQPDGCPVPELLRVELLSQLQGLQSLTERIEALERRIGSWQRRESDCARLAAIPGVGRLTATAVVATVADARSFRSGREFAAFLGLVPRQSGTGGRVKMLGISKRGDPYLRTLLIHGARSVMLSQSRADRVMDPWLKEVLARRPKNVAIVAMANKMARTIWALLAHGRSFDPNWGRTAMAVATGS
ncbi:MAG: IS110 family transposase [Gallionella sp.]|jgi:transposase|nr:IS110 family transposase [Gallionella sp.]